MPTCQKCGRAIVWEETKNGRMRPLNPNGAVHFAICEKSDTEIVAAGRARRRTRRTVALLDRAFEQALENDGN